LQILQFAAAALMAGAVALVSRSLALLSRSGAWAAFALGTLVFGLGGWRAALPLLAFFASSSVLGRLRRWLRPGLRFAKDGPRGARQVAANSGVAAFSLLLSVVSAHASSGYWAAIYAAALASANADTWATEIGGLSSKEPRLITTMRRVPAGVSGAISLQGVVASAAGAALVGVSACWLPGFSMRLLLIVSAAGVAGMLCDSLLGAMLQARYQTADGAISEERGEGSKRVSGLTWLNNDGVNFTASAIAASIACALCGK
jgi:uncharacterized protein (TIGR00297 family)